MIRYPAHFWKLFIPVFLVAMIAQLPGAWMLQYSRDRLPVDLQWSAVSGSVWDTRIDKPVLLLGDSRRLDFRSARLRLSPLSVFRAEPQLDYRFQAEDHEFSGRFVLSRDAWSYEDMKGRLPLAYLPHFWTGVDISGFDADLVLTDGELAGVAGRLPDDGRLNFRIEQLQMETADGFETLGDYALELGPVSESAMHGSLQSLPSSALEIDGELSVDFAARELILTGYVQLTDDNAEVIGMLLPLLGSVDNQGRVALDWKLGL